MSDDATPRGPASAVRKFALALWLALWPLLAVLYFYPIRDTPLRYLIAGVWVMLGVGTVAIFWQRRIARYLGAAVVLGVAATALVPGRAPDPEAMRVQYTQALHAYADTPYVWGGESPRGIDCSGLLRRPLMDANLRQGLRSANPRLLRRALTLWWHDCSAKALGEEYRGWTRRLLTTPSLNRLDYTRLQPGDIAVTTGGNHCMAYLGERTWIEADPSALVGDKVIEVTVPSKNAWFSTPMRILRWQDMDG